MGRRSPPPAPEIAEEKHALGQTEFNLDHLDTGKISFPRKDIVIEVGLWGATPRFGCIRPLAAAP